LWLLISLLLWLPVGGIVWLVPQCILIHVPHQHYWMVSVVIINYGGNTIPTTCSLSLSCHVTRLTVRPILEYLCIYWSTLQSESHLSRAVYLGTFQLYPGLIFCSTFDHWNQYISHLYISVLHYYNLDHGNCLDLL